MEVLPYHEYKKWPEAQFMGAISIKFFIAFISQKFPQELGEL
jgi:hypothetical protein